MFEYLYEWIRNMAFYMVMVTAILHIVPDSGYRKYIRFFTSLVLVMLLASPILKLFGMEQKIWNLYDSREYQEQLQKLEDATQYLERIEEYGDVEAGTTKTEGSREGMNVEEIRIGR